MLVQLKLEKYIIMINNLYSIISFIEGYKKNKVVHYIFYQKICKLNQVKVQRKTKGKLKKKRKKKEE